MQLWLLLGETPTCFFSKQHIKAVHIYGVPCDFFMFVLMCNVHFRVYVSVRSNIYHFYGVETLQAFLSLVLCFISLRKLYSMLPLSLAPELVTIT